MAIAAYFANESFDKKKYEETLKRLEAAGQGAPKGRKYHSCFGEGDHLMVFDVWESQEDLDRFGETLMPILAVSACAGSPIQIHTIWSFSATG